MKRFRVLIIGIIIASGCTDKAVKIIPITVVNRHYVDSTKTPPRQIKIDNYLIQNYKELNLYDLDSFAFVHLDSSSLKNGMDFRMVFYKESDKTNLKNIQKDINVVEDYSHWHDLVYSYAWFKGNFIRDKIINGVPVNEEKGTVILENVEEK